MYGVFVSSRVFSVCNIKLISQAKFISFVEDLGQSRSDPGGYRITGDCDCGKEDREEEEKEEEGDRTER